MRHQKLIIIGVVVVVVIAGAALIAALLSGSVGGNSQTDQENAASSTVAAFGELLQQVSITAPDASTVIASTYAPYVAPALLQQWEASPTSAPGRVVSSPWPDHIQIDSVAPQGTGYVVNGELVFMTSDNVEHGGNAGTTPVVISLSDENGTWQITALQGSEATQQ